MTDTVSAEDMASLAQFYKLLMIMAVVAGTALYAQLLRNRKHWMIMEVCLGVSCALAIPFGKTLVPYYYPDIDSLSIYLYQIVWSAMVARAAAIFFMRNSESRDPTVAVGLCVTNILERGVILLCISYCIFYYRTLPEFRLKLKFTFCALLMLGEILHLSKVSTRDGRLIIRGPISKHLAFDGVISFIFGTFLLGFSDMFITLMNPDFDINEMNLSLSKVVGCFLLGGSLLTFASLCFRNPTDSISILQSRLVMYIPVLILSVLYYQEDQYRTVGHVGLIMGVVGILAVNAESAIWRRQIKID